MSKKFIWIYSDIHSCNFRNSDIHSYQNFHECHTLTPSPALTKWSSPACTFKYLFEPVPVLQQQLAQRGACWCALAQAPDLSNNSSKIDAACDREFWFDSTLSRSWAEACCAAGTSSWLLLHPSRSRWCLSMNNDNAIIEQGMASYIWSKIPGTAPRFEILRWQCVITEALIVSKSSWKLITIIFRSWPLSQESTKEAGGISDQVREIWAIICDVKLWGRVAGKLND